MRKGVARREFDAAYYRQQLLEEGFVIEGDLLRHFLTVGWRLRLDPSPGFSIADYLDRYPDVGASGLNPWLHYLRRGSLEGRSASPSRRRLADLRPPAHSAAAVGSGAGPTNPDLERRRALCAYLAELGIEEHPESVGGVDAGYYVARYEKLLPEGTDAASHYRSVGWRMALSPTPWFDSEAYFALYPDIREHDLDPFEHFCQAGFRESRLPRARNLRRVEYARTPPSQGHRLVLAAAEAQEDGIGASGMVAQLAQLGIDAFDRIAVSFSHDQFLAVAGGIQICVTREQRTFADRGVGSLVFFPVVPRASLAPIHSRRHQVRLAFNGTLLEGSIWTGEIRQLVDALVAGRRSLDAVVVHSLFGHHVELLGKQLRGLGSRRWIWWVHDYYLQCVNPSLTHDSVRPCGNPPPGSAACLTCRFGRERITHVERLGAIHAEFPWLNVAPSAIAAQRAASGPFALSCVPEVLPHAALADLKSPLRADRNGPLRIAYVGMPSPHKGWFTFCNLVQERSGPEVSFHHFGVESGDLRGVDFVELGPNAGTQFSPEEVLASHEVDAVLIWAEWEETFSLVTLEALAAGCVVICRSGSGNVEALARLHGAALVYSSEDELLDDHSLTTRVRALRRGLAPRRVLHSGLTPALLVRAEELP